MIRIPQLSRTPLLNSSHPKFQSREAQILEGTVYEIWYARRAESQNPLSERQVQKRVQQLDQQLCFDAELWRSHGKQHERNPAENHGASCPCHPCRPRPSGRGAGQVEATPTGITQMRRKVGWPCMKRALRSPGRSAKRCTAVRPLHCKLVPFSARSRDVLIVGRGGCNSPALSRQFSRVVVGATVTRYILYQHKQEGD
jgi:hypothetical protein